jgi:hypothetical protein
MHITEPPPRPSHHTIVVHELDDLVHAMLSKDPEGRPSLAEVLFMLEHMAASERTHIRVQTPLPANTTDEMSVPPVAVSAIEVAQSGSPTLRDARVPQELTSLRSIALAETQLETKTQDSVVGPPVRRRHALWIGAGLIAIAVIVAIAIAAGGDSSVEATATPDAALVAEQAVDAAPALYPEDVVPEITIDEPKPRPQTKPIKVESVKTETKPDTKPPVKIATKPPVKVETRPPVKVETRPPVKVETKPAKTEVTIIVREVTSPTIIIDGVVTGPRSHLTPGTHTLVVKAAGRKTITRTIQVTTAPFALGVTMERDPVGNGLKQPKDWSEPKR